MICARNESNFFFSSSWEREEAIWQKYTKHTITVPKKPYTFPEDFFFSFKVIVRVVKSTFSVLLLKTFTSFPKDTSTEQWFWLDFFFFGLERPTTYQMSIFAFHCWKSQLAITHFVILQNMKYHYKIDIQTWCVATGFKEGKHFLHC